MPNPIRVTQGATRTVVVSGIVDSAGAPLTVTGWTVHAQVREAQEGPLLAEWVSGTPTGSQGQATASGTSVTLSVPYAMSSAWTFRTGRLHVELTEPGVNGRRERIADERIVVDPEIVREAP